MPDLTTTTLGRFCRELAGGLDDLSVILKEWHVTQADWEGIQSSPAFVTEMRLVEAEMRELGNDAGYVYRMKSLSEQMLPEVVKLLMSDHTTPTMKFEMIKWVAEMARLKEKPVPKGEFQGPRGPSVIFKFGAGLPISSMTVHSGEIENQVGLEGTSADVPHEGQSIGSSVYKNVGEPHKIMGASHEIMRSEPVDNSGWPT